MLSPNKFTAEPGFRELAMRKPQRGPVVQVPLTDLKTLLKVAYWARYAVTKYKTMRYAIDRNWNPAVYAAEMTDLDESIIRVQAITTTGGK